MESKLCGTCQRILPRSQFDDDPEQHDGCRRICKECLEAGPLRKKRGYPPRRTSAKRAIEQLTSKLSGSKDVPDIIKTLDSIVAKFGSAESLAGELVKTYHDAEPGSQSRVRILIATLRLLMAAAPLKSGADWLDMPTDQLEAVVLKLFNESKASKDVPAKTG